MTTEKQIEEIAIINFNDRELLLELIQYAKRINDCGNSNILESFLNLNHIKKRLRTNKLEKNAQIERAANSHYWR